VQNGHPPRVFTARYNLCTCSSLNPNVFRSLKFFLLAMSPGALISTKLTEDSNPVRTNSLGFLSVLFPILHFPNSDRNFDRLFPSLLCVRSVPFPPKPAGLALSLSRKSSASFWFAPPNLACSYPRLGSFPALYPFSFVSLESYIKMAVTNTRSREILPLFPQGLVPSSSGFSPPVTSCMA